MTDDRDQLQEYIDLAKLLSKCAHMLSDFAMKSSEPYVMGVATSTSNMLASQAETITKGLRNSMPGGGDT